MLLLSWYPISHKQLGGLFYLFNPTAQVSHSVVETQVSHFRGQEIIIGISSSFEEIEKNPYFVYWQRGGRNLIFRHVIQFV